MKGPIFQEGVMPTSGKSVIWRAQGGDVKPPHFHGQLEFLLLRRGSARLIVGETSFSLKARELVMILPGLTHFTDNLSSDLDMWVMGFEPEHVQEQSCSKCLSSTTSPYHGWLLSLAQSIRARPIVELDRMNFEFFDDTCALQSDLQVAGFAPSGLDQILLTAFQLAKVSANDRHVLSLPLLATCLVAEDPTIDRSELCKKLDVSASFLARSFKQELGVGMLSLHSRARVASFLAHARQGSSLLSAGYAAGFGSYSQLYRSFSQVTGWKPKDYLLGNGRDRAAKASL